MAQLSQGESANIILAPGEAYEIMTGGVASVVGLYGAPSGTTTLTNESQSFGPYGVNAKLRLTATTGEATYTLARIAPIGYNTATGEIEDPQSIAAVAAAAAAASLPAGGTTGQVLAKASGDDGDAEWVDPEAGSAPADGSITLAKMANLAQDQVIGRTTASTGVPETFTVTAAARTVLDDTTVAAMVNTLGGATSSGTGGLVRATNPTLADFTLSGGVVLTAAAMGAEVIDVTELYNTRTLSGATTFTFSATPGNGQQFGQRLIGHSAPVVVTIPSSRNIQTNEDITTFVMPANGYAYLTWMRDGSVNMLTGVPGMKLAIPFAIEEAADGDYPVFVNLPWAGRVDAITTDCASGTCTLTGKVNTTNLGGTANSVSTTQTTQAHTTTNTFVATDRIVVTVSSNSSCTRIVGTILVTVY